MSENELFDVSGEWAERAWVDNDKYLEMYRQSTEDGESFWGDPCHSQP